MCALQFPEHSFYNLRDKILLFRHDAYDQNVLRLITTARDIVDGTLVEVVLSGMIISSLFVLINILRQKFYTLCCLFLLCLT